MVRIKVTSPYRAGINGPLRKVGEICTESEAVAASAVEHGRAVYLEEPKPEPAPEPKPTKPRDTRTRKTAQRG